MYPALVVILVRSQSSSPVPAVVATDRQERIGGTALSAMRFNSTPSRRPNGREQVRSEVLRLTVAESLEVSAGSVPEQNRTHPGEKADANKKDSVENVV